MQWTYVCTQCQGTNQKWTTATEKKNGRANCKWKLEARKRKKNRMKGGTIVSRLCKQYVLLSCIWWAFYLIFKPSLQCLFLLKKVFCCHMFYGLFQSEKHSRRTESESLAAAAAAPSSFKTRWKASFTERKTMKTLSTNGFASFKLIFSRRVFHSIPSREQFFLISKQKFLEFSFWCTC